MLQVNHLSVRYRGIHALENVRFSVEPGRVVGILGPNGAGKSTMLKAMLGLVASAEGSVLLDDRPLHQQRSRVAYVPQQSQIDWDYPITVWNFVMTAQTVDTGIFRRPGRSARLLAAAALERVDVADLRDRPISDLSGGQRQRVFLARALAKRADVFFLDEPFTGVDRKTEDIIFDIFRELKAAAKTLLVVHHDLGESLNHYDRLVLLNKYLVAVGTRPEVMTIDNLARAYGQPLQLAAV
ncbi:metal ABC transporter ATP-binding protein [Synechococcus sp. PCC 7336]|uniref:metal ABC transporter ATP-binding protein n=1 Tax=Synechococcus sp. PCC 7336 TaxID=195250 RepID=UPI000366588B|nr:metal ABC transporter ATP-binding protein [Synechococcus sp. PCC 7336]